MLDEAREAPGAVARLLAADRDVYASLGAELRAAPPQSLLTIARGSSDHAAHYMAYLIMARLGRLVTSLPMSLITLYQSRLQCDGLVSFAFSQSGQSHDLVVPTTACAACPDLRLPKLSEQVYYWRANAENTNLSDSLRQLYGLWMSGKSIANDVGRQAIGKGYPVFSWYCIMSGMGIFPDPKDLRPATVPENRYSMEEIDNLLQRSAQNFKSQRDMLMKIPKKVDERSLQIYFW